jgi:hypothetical protein
MNSAVDGKVHIHDDVAAIPIFHQTLMVLPYAIISQSMKLDATETAETTIGNASGGGMMSTAEGVDGNLEATEGNAIGNADKTSAVHMTQPNRVSLDELQRYREILYATNARCPDVFDRIDDITPHASWSEQRRNAREGLNGEDNVQQGHGLGDVDWTELFDWSALSSFTDYASDDFWFRPDIQ